METSEDSEVVEHMSVTDRLLVSTPFLAPQAAFLWVRRVVYSRYVVFRQWVIDEQLVRALALVKNVVSAGIIPPRILSQTWR